MTVLVLTGRRRRLLLLHQRGLAGSSTRNSYELHANSPTPEQTLMTELRFGSFVLFGVDFF